MCKARCQILRKKIVKNNIERRSAICEHIIIQKALLLYPYTHVNNVASISLSKLIYKPLIARNNIDVSPTKNMHVKWGQDQDNEQ